MDECISRYWVMKVEPYLVFKIKYILFMLFWTKQNSMEKSGLTSHGLNKIVVPS